MIRFYDEELSAPRPTPMLEEPPLVGCPRLLIQYIRGCKEIVKTGWRVVRPWMSSYEPIHGRTTCQPVLTTYPQPRHIPTRDYNITQ